MSPAWNWTSAVLFTFLSPLSFGQHALLVSNERGEPEVVVAAKSLRPVVLREGKPVVSMSDSFAISEHGSYIYTFVQFRRLVAAAAIVEDEKSPTGNKPLILLKGEIESGVTLENVFLVFCVDAGGGIKGINLLEIGRLEAGLSKSISVKFPARILPKDGKVTLLVFSGGKELFHSEMKESTIKEALDDLVAEKTENVASAAARPLLGPQPEYPKNLRRKGVEGKASLSLALDAGGHVTEASLVEATDALFGEAALKVIRQWRFLPKVEAGKAVASKVRFEMPFRLPKESQ